MLKLSNILYDELNKKQIDWEAVQRILAANRALINEFDDDDTSLSDSYDLFFERGKDAYKLTQLFLENGFDVKANNGKNGASCLERLCWSLYDAEIVEIAELLLEAGADPLASTEEDNARGILSSIDFKLCYWGVGEEKGYLDSANIFEAYHLLAERAQKGKPYIGIHAFRKCIGSTVSKIEKIQISGETEAEEKGRTCYVLHCADNMLVISDHIDFIVNPYAKENAIKTIDVTAEYTPIIGATIKGLRFKDAHNAALSFKNGYCLKAVNYNNCCDISCRWLSLEKTCK